MQELVRMGHAMVKQESDDDEPKYKITKAGMAYLENKYPELKR